MGHYWLGSLDKNGPGVLEAGPRGTGRRRLWSPCSLGGNVTLWYLISDLACSRLPLHPTGLQGPCGQSFLRLYSAGAYPGAGLALCQPTTAGANTPHVLNKNISLSSCDFGNRTERPAPGRTLGWLGWSSPFLTASRSENMKFIRV